MTLFNTLRAASLSLALVSPLALLAGGAFAQNAEVLATVNGEQITTADLAAAEAELGDSIENMQATEKRDYLLSFLIDMKIMASEGAKRGVEDTEGYKIRMKFLRERVLMQTVLAEEAAKSITEDDMMAFYNEAVERAPKEEEAHARHILVETEEKAKDILQKIRDGADFAEMAKEHSTGPSGPKGGDLGFFGKGRMVPEFDAAVFAMKAGDVSEPVKTQFGWHLIKLEEMRVPAPPAFEDVKGQIRSMLQRQRQAEFVGKIRETATIERAGEDGETKSD